MKFAVEWKPEATDRLADLWNDNPELRNDITAASHRIDQKLMEDATNAGESREYLNERILFEPPLRIYFSIDSAAKAVVVVSVDLIKRQTSQ